MPESLVGKYMRAAKLPIEKGRKTHQYRVEEIRTGHTLGFLMWYGPWREYCFSANHGTIYDPGCLKQLATWCMELTNAYKAERKELPVYVDAD